MDSLQLPLPPTTLTFSFPSKPQRPQAFRYNRAGTRFDAQKAVIGKVRFRGPVERAQALHACSSAEGTDFCARSSALAPVPQGGFGTVYR